jgi:hypothetical protein
LGDATDRRRVTLGGAEKHPPGTLPKPLVPRWHFIAVILR